MTDDSLDLPEEFEQAEGGIEHVLKQYGIEDVTEVSDQEFKELLDEGEISGNDLGSE